MTTLPHVREVAIKAAQANFPGQGGLRGNPIGMLVFVRYRTRDGNSGLTPTTARLLSEQLTILPLNIAVALARDGFQAGAVENGYVSIRVMDQASVFQSAGGDGHAGPADSQHH